MAGAQRRCIVSFETCSTAEISEIILGLSCDFSHAAQCINKLGVTGDAFVNAGPETLISWGFDPTEAAQVLATLGERELESSDLEERLVSFGQQHCLHWLKKGRLSVSQAKSLACSLKLLDLKRVRAVFENSSAVSAAVASEVSIEPPEESSCVSLSAIPLSERLKYENIGKEEIAGGRAAVIILGGGQGTRLGFDGPKGMYDIGLPSGKSLFQLYAERIASLTRLVQDDVNEKDASASATAASSTVVIPLFVMTSPLNHTATRNFFERNSFFGLHAEHVHFFPQGTLPALTQTEGKIIMQSGSEVSQAPDGNGGIYNALEVSGALAQLEGYGCRSVHVFSVDNAISKAADPTFLGFCLSRKAEVGNKVVWKRSPEERVGVVARKDRRTAIVEYTELSGELAKSTDASGKLRFGAGNICNHYFTVPFLRHVATTYKEEPAVMPYHVAVKKIPEAHEDTGATVPPDEPNGAKLEAFIFDSFPLASSSVILEVDREEEFTPVKNAPGAKSDSPEAAKQMIADLHRNWVKTAGGSFSEDATSTLFEISPFVSYAGEGLEKYCRGKIFLPGEVLVTGVPVSP